MMVRRPRGTADITPGEAAAWRHVEEAAREVCRRFGYREIRTPIFEHSELFTRGVGDSTDIVEKEMYTFEDRGGRSITLRAEGTAPAARLYLEEGLHAQAQPVKLYYVSWPVFRYERPQAGRLRQHHQFGVECFGSPDPAVDAEVMLLVGTFLRELGLAGAEFRLNCIGCPDCRGAYREALVEYFAGRKEQLCADCRRRLRRNPLRLLDCKEESCARLREEAPAMEDYLCAGCRDHHERLCEILDDLGLPYRPDSTLVRGLDYYTRTVFEVNHPALGAQDAVCAGGRYDGLVETLGGDPAPGVGFGLGIERLLMVLREQKVPLPGPPGLDAFVVTIGEEARRPGLRLVAHLRESGFSCDIDYMERSVRAQMSFADRYPSRYVLLLGGEELARSEVTVRDMRDGSQEQVARDELVERLDGLVRSGRGSE